MLKSVNLQVGFRAARQATKSGDGRFLARPRDLRNQGTDVPRSPLWFEIARSKTAARSVTCGACTICA